MKPTRREATTKLPGIFRGIRTDERNARTLHERRRIMTSKTENRQRSESLPRFERVNHGQGHAYKINGHNCPGITSIINKGFPKSLASWGANMAANSVVDDWQKLQGMSPSARLKYVSQAPYRDMNRAAIKGTKVHTFAERIARGEKMQIPGEIAGYVQGAIDFLREWKVEPLHIEVPVFNVTEFYAGTTDLIAKLADEKIWILDYKSSRTEPFGNTAYQTCAYKFCEYALVNDQVVPMPAIDACGIVWLQPDGTYEFSQLECDKQVFAEFLCIKGTSDAVENSKFYKSAPLSPPVELDAAL